MNDKIKVGDRVRGNHGGAAWTVVGIGGNTAWLRAGKDNYTVRLLEVLTRIEPEKVVLTPKYAVAQRLRTSPLRLNTTADNIYVVKGPVVGYELESGGWLPESLLSPIPDPCPECGGSGVASE